MRVRLERDVSSSTLGPLARVFEGDGLGVFDLVEKIETFAGYRAVGVDDDRTDQRPRANLAGALGSKVKRTLHHQLIKFG